MKGNFEIIAALNARLTEELTAVGQYEAHRAALALQEYSKLVEYLAERIADERKHYNLLSERIRFLEGTIIPGMNPVNIGEDIRTMHSNDLASELDAIGKYRETITLCIQMGDAGTRQVLESILSDEEDHCRDLESQLTQIGQMTVENYLSAKL
jgi:bacterioferritin